MSQKKEVSNRNSTSSPSHSVQLTSLRKYKKQIKTEALFWDMKKKEERYTSETKSSV